MKMIDMKRADYGIEYPSHLPYFKTKGITELVALDIELKNDDFKLGAIGCSASAGEFTDNALFIINKALKDSILQSSSYSEHLNYWFHNSTPNYQQQYQERVVKYRSQTESVQ
ncbi:MAG: hypothetical protein HWE10_10045 [Gammaproteobacteria bacterium]|nr:hypothetical protein [Gammaproteobacteria bacterium]